MAVVKTKIGEGECPACKREVVWRQAERGALTCTCQHCDLQIYAKHGTEAERILLKRITPAIKTPPAPDPVPQQTPEPKPTAKRGAFGLAGY